MLYWGVWGCKKMLFTIIALICDVIKIGLLFMVYKDVALYFPLPILNSAQFFGTMFLIEGFKIYFDRNYTNLETYKKLTDKARFAYCINKTIAMVVLFLFYQIVRLFV